jgi:hypothetical protein
MNGDAMDDDDELSPEEWGALLEGIAAALHVPEPGLFDDIGVWIDRP